MRVSHVPFTILVWASNIMLLLIILLLGNIRSSKASSDQDPDFFPSSCCCSQPLSRQRQAFFPPHPTLTEWWVNFHLSDPGATEGTNGLPGYPPRLCARRSPGPALRGTFRCGDNQFVEIGTADRYNVQDRAHEPSERSCSCRVHEHVRGPDKDIRLNGGKSIWRTSRNIDGLCAVTYP